jgi:hypothetical protein
MIETLFDQIEIQHKALITIFSPTDKFLGVSCWRQILMDHTKEIVRIKESKSHIGEVKIIQPMTLALLNKIIYFSILKNRCSCDLKKLSDKSFKTPSYQKKQ